MGLGALWGLLEKDSRSPAKRLVWSCPAPSGPQPLAAMLCPDSPAHLQSPPCPGSWQLPDAPSPPHHLGFPFRKRGSFTQNHQPMASIRPLEGRLLWPWGPPRRERPSMWGPQGSLLPCNPAQEWGSGAVRSASPSLPSLAAGRELEERMFGCFLWPNYYSSLHPLCRLEESA